MHKCNLKRDARKEIDVCTKCNREYFIQGKKGQCRGCFGSFPISKIFFVNKMEYCGRCGREALLNKQGYTENKKAEISQGLQQVEKIYSTLESLRRRI